MKTRKKSPCRQLNPTAFQRSAGPSPIQRTRLLIDAACAARASSGQMTLNDWRDVEQGLKRRILQDGVLELHVPRRPPPDENGKSNIIPFEEPHYEHPHS